MATKTSTVLLICFLACLLLVKVEGQVGHSKARCLCLNGEVNYIRHNLIEKIVEYQSSVSCPRKEIIVTLKNKTVKRCLNPNAPYVKRVINKWIENQSVMRMEQLGNMCLEEVCETIPDLMRSS